MPIDLAKWQAAGIPAELAALVVEVNRALLRVPSKGDPGRGIVHIAAANGGLSITMSDGAVTNINDLRAALAEEDAEAIAQSLAQADAAALAAVTARNDIAARPPAVAALEIEDGRIIQIMTDESRIDGPELPSGGGPEPTASPLTMTGDGFTLSDPASRPEITITMTSDGFTAALALN